MSIVLYYHHIWGCTVYLPYMNIPLLGIHSHFSFLNGVSKIKDIVSDAKTKGYTSLLLTDNANMSAVVEWCKECEKNDIKPLFGVSLFLEGDETCHPRLTLVAKSNKGFSNLSSIVSDSGLSLSQNGKPITTKKMLQTYATDIVAIIPPVNNDVTNERDVEEYKRIFGDNLFIGITYQDIPEHQRDAMISLANVCNVNIVVHPLIYYLNKEDADLRDIVLKIQKTRRPELEQEIFPTADMSIPQHDVMVDRVKTVCTNFSKEILENTERLQDICTVTFSFGTWNFPNVVCETTPEEDLKKMVLQGLKHKGFDIHDPTVKNRVKTELEVIINKGYAKYFLVTKIIVDYMHANGVPTTTRGSAAGCLVSYSLNITNIDPLKYNIPFERFLNPFRPSPPDIDIDIADNNRNDVIQFIREHFGENNVAQIGTFGTMMARAVARDVARALGYPYTTGDRIAKLIPLGKQGMPMTVSRAMEEVPELKDLYTTNNDVKKILDIAMKIEGNVRHISVHAAGVVIDTDDIKKRIPIQVNPKDNDKIITQYNMHAVEDAGLLKFDILGITNLTTLKNTVDMIAKKYGKKIDLHTIPLDDPKPFNLLKKGFTKGLFQLGGSGITQVVKDIQPESLENISAIIALYRPGPMANIHAYARRKKGIEKIEYIHPIMEEYLQPSYGVLVYQEDVLFTAIKLAGYTWEEVDVFRKAIGKKIPELMAAAESEFKERCETTSGLNKDTINAIWDLFVPFQGYGFNKAHAMSYGFVAYQTAYLKAHYPAEFMACVLSSAHGDLDEIYELIRECKSMNIKILPPSVNHSEIDFSTENNNIRTGFLSIKNLGSGVSESIYSERVAHGEYTSIRNFIERLSTQCLCSRRDIEALIKSGSLDCLEERETLLSSTETIFAYIKETRSQEKHTNSLFDTTHTKKELHLSKKQSYAKTQLFAWEKEFTGMYVSGNPLDMVEQQGHGIKYMQSVKNQEMLFTGIITSLKMHRNKTGKQMCFFRLEDTSGSIESVCFPDVFEKYQDYILENRPIYATGKIKDRNGAPSFLIERVQHPKLK